MNYPKGIDVSHGDNVDWNNFTWDFIFCKATESTNFHDPAFKARQAHFRSANIPMSPYHFMRPGSGLEQAKWFCDMIGPVQKGDLPPCLDWEVEGIVVREGLDWIDYVAKFSNQTPIIYGPQSLLESMNLHPIVMIGPLYLAHPGLSLPLDPSKIPAPWKSVTFLQTGFAEKGTMSGFDEDVFNGTMGQLQALRRQ